MTSSARPSRRRTPNPQVRLQYATDALVFAELPGVWSLWKRALEGWNVRVSQQVLEWQAEARAEAVVKTQRAVILRVLELHCGSKAPADVVSAVQSSEDTEQLTRWIDAAATAKSYDEFRAALKA